MDSKYCPDVEKDFDVDDGFVVEKDLDLESMVKRNNEVAAKVSKEFNFRASDQQIGGNHYKGMKIQPFEYAMKNNFNAGQFGVLKYISRYKMKNGLEDLRKAKHFLELLAEEEYNEKL